jgi:hypothetical protein
LESENSGGKFLLYGVWVCFTTCNFVWCFAVVGLTLREKDMVDELIKRLESEINKTPSGDLRNLLCDANIVLRALNDGTLSDGTHVVIKVKIGSFVISPDEIAKRIGSRELYNEIKGL